MDRQIKFAIIAICIIIPLSSFIVYQSGQTPQQPISKSNSKLVVISSFHPLYEFAKKVGQEKIDLILLVPEGVEPHDWEPTIYDIQNMQQADLIFINGIGFESWVNNVHFINSKIQIIDTSVGIKIKNNKILETNESKSNADSISDPHIWLNPKMAQIQVQNIANALSKNDPENQDYYQKNSQSYIKELELLDNEIRIELSKCNHDFIASHNAFSYFADEYGLVQHTIINSNDPEAEPTSKTLEKIINLARKNDINVIFAEEGIDSKTSQIITNEIGGKVLVLSPLEIGTKNFTYIDRMKQNLSNLKEALCR
jgi:zinc transport system substrate-binding protein